MSRYLKWAQKEYPLRTRIPVSLLAGVLFLILFPYLLLVTCPSVDRQLGFHPFDAGATSYIIGGILTIVGLAFALWSILVQVTRGRGTPLPMLPTQTLLTTGPFQYCRNPMTLGTILAYLGIAIAAATAVGIAAVLIFGVLLVLYLKLLEERELAERFGEQYLAYRREVPFILPRRPRRK